jgi:hypothetical protein
MNKNIAKTTVSVLTVLAISVVYPGILFVWFGFFLLNYFDFIVKFYNCDSCAVIHGVCLEETAILYIH